MFWSDQTAVMVMRMERQMKMDCSGKHVIVMIPSGNCLILS